MKKPFPSAPIAIPGANVNRTQNISEDVPNDTDEAEMPEVALDCNRHIISEWMLCGGRNRSLSHSNVNGTLCVAQRRLWGVLPQGTASSPDLPSLTMSHVDQSKPNLPTPSMYHPNYSALFGQQNHCKGTFRSPFLLSIPTITRASGCLPVHFHSTASPLN
jgi:hypothetical protein